MRRSRDSALGVSVRVRRHRRGMVLLDAVLMLAVVALAAYVLMPIPTGGLSDRELQAEAAEIAARFRQARTFAIRNRTPVEVVVDARGSSIGGIGQPMIVRDGIRLDWTTSDQCPLRGGLRALRFLADGRSCGGVLQLSGNGYGAKLRVDWFTGRVEIDRQ